MDGDEVMFPEENIAGLYKVLATLSCPTKYHPDNAACLIRSIPIT